MNQDYSLDTWKKECPRIDCKKACECGIKLVIIPPALGDDTEGSKAAPKNGAYCNSIVKYQSNGHIYFYSADGVPTYLPSGGVENFDELLGRPKYNGYDMKSTTNIPKVPEAISELTNDSNYQTASDVSTAIGIETSARELADSSLQSQINAIKNAPDVVDIVSTYADLQAYDTSGLTDKDIIRVLADETHDGESSYYRWNASTETWTYIGSIHTVANTIFYANVSESGNNRHIYKNSDMTGAVSAQDILSANEDGQVILRMSTSLTPELYNDAYLQNTYVGVGDYQFLFLDNLHYYEYDASATTDTTYYYSKSTIQLLLTAGTGIDITGNVISSTATGGGVITLTTDDYNWNRVAGDSTTEPFDSIALWLLDNNIYYVPPTLRTNTLYAGSANLNQEQTMVAVSSIDSHVKAIAVLDGEPDDKIASYTVEDGYLITQNYILRNDMVVDNLTSNYAESPLSAKQGKVLKDLIDSLVIKGAGAPTTSTVGTVGQLYQDTTNGKLYICTAVTPGTDPDPDTYTWVEVGAGGSSQLIELSTDDYDYPTNNPTKVALWNLPAGIYTSSVQNLGIQFSTSDSYVLNPNQMIFITASGTGNVKYISFNLEPTSGNNGWLWYTTRTNDGSSSGTCRIPTDVVDNLTSTYSRVALSANQGRVLNNKIEGRIITNAGAPTTATVGTVGMILEDTTNGDLYICTDTTGGTYTWEEVGGAQLDVFTTNEWNALWA